MEIVIVAGGMPFGPDTLDHFSLGGSETAAQQIAKALKARDHLVTVFCNLPPAGRPDFHQSGALGSDKVRYVQMEAYEPFITSTEVDLLIVSRDPTKINLPHQARKAVLWMHDLATHEFMGGALPHMAWCFDEIWAVSEFHRQQIHQVTGYPLRCIRATRNGIVKVDVLETERLDNQLLYAARPERGLEHLVRPDGIMSRLPEFNLKVCMYANFPEHMRGYYTALNEWASRLPNVEILGSKTQTEMRQLIHDSAAYVYPTSFEETSCILTRECIEQKTPFITTRAGALIDSLGDCGVYVDGLPELGKTNDEFYQAFADTVKSILGSEGAMREIVANMNARDDLYWDQVAAEWESWATAAEPQLYSKIRSMIEDSDIVPAIALMGSAFEGAWTLGVEALGQQLEKLYPYLHGKESFADYYERYFKREDEKGARHKPDMDGNSRFEAIAREIAALPDGSAILDYGCAEGVIILGLAKRFPNKSFCGVDFAASNIELCRKYAEEDGLKNVYFAVGSSDDWPPEAMPPVNGYFDAAICSEVLEHVEKPWELATFVESKVTAGGRVIITVPAGPWEATGLYDKDQWFWRAHIWHINKWMLRKMFADKATCNMSSLANGHFQDMRAIGHTVFAYEADHKPVHAVDPLEKAEAHRARHTLGAAIIAMNSQATILKTLDSIGRVCSQINVALGPSTDQTEQLTKTWAKEHPWCEVSIIPVPKIEPGAFGFDDARNRSIAGLDTDWILWIDTDEYLSLPENVLKYLRSSAVESYAVHQHHFACDPRGAPPQIDKPARIFRNHHTFKFYGKVHEHAEVSFNGGPGFCHLIMDADIGHIGYENEAVRRLRFNRNFPLLEWDRQVYPERKLGHYLWMRDIIHRMRYYIEIGQVPVARQLAQDAIDFYEGHWQDLDAFGSAAGQSLGYLTEARAFLGQGLELQTVLRSNGREMAITGRFHTVDELTRLLAKVLQPEIDRNNSKYLR
jgi:SAM-dependent methyltransferase/glycosyltransferase involved in cell wall biosynthesis